MPLDIEPTPLGHVILDDDGRAAVVNDAEREWARRMGRTLYRAHFASCGRLVA